MASDKSVTKHVLLVTFVLVLGIKENNAHAVTQHPSTEPNSTTIPTCTPSALNEPLSYCEYKLQEIEMCDGLHAYLEGPKGDIGPVGPQGSMGSRGEKGDLGEGGSIGLIGLKGNKGEQGVSLQGHHGHKGLKGSMGSRGEKGNLGEGGLIGLRGETGLTGSKGNTGDYGVGLQGDMGLKGQKGATGARSNFAAFSVSRTTGLTASSGNVRITYNVETIDYGNNIPTSTGIFTCDIAGVYFFSFSFESDGDYDCLVSLYKNSAKQISTSAAPIVGGRNIVVSQSIILSLQNGDRVWLEVNSGSSIDDAYNALNKPNTFNGYLIHET